MNKLVKFAAVAVFMVASATTHASTQPASVKSFVAGSLDVRDMEKSMHVYAEYEGEPEITEALRNRIAELGYKISADPEDADVVFKVTRTFHGKASDRPKSGIYDGDRSINSINMPKLLLFAVIGASTGATLTPSSVLQRPTQIDFWHGAMKDTGVITEIEHTFKLTKKPQEAVISHIELTVNGVTQSADVVSESYAKELPGAAIVGENLRQVLWYFE